MVELKKLKPEAVSSALKKAKQYRLLNEPDEAESICLDILDAVPGQQEALVILLLSLTDKFVIRGLNPSFEQAKEIVPKLDSRHCKAYYQGVIFERRAKFHLRQGGPGCGEAAYVWFSKAMSAYGEALDGCDPKEENAVLRWNSCARIINENPEVKAEDNAQPEMLLDSFDTPH